MNEIEAAISIIFKSHFRKDSFIRVFKNFVIVETENPSFKFSALEHDMRQIGFDCQFAEILKLSDVQMFLLSFPYMKKEDKGVQKIFLKSDYYV